MFFGIFLVSMLFVPPSMPFMVPEAEADHGDVMAITTDKQIYVKGDDVEIFVTGSVTSSYIDNYPECGTSGTVYVWISGGASSYGGHAVPVSLSTSFLSICCIGR